ncbi:hypothetical protein ACHQM5_005319 [Ranunculus cassubicifolius]
MSGKKNKQIIQFPTNLSTFAATASAVAMTMMIQLVKELIPFADIKRSISKNITDIFRFFSPEITMVIKEFNDLCPNQYYSDAKTYLHSKALTATKRFEISKATNSEKHLLCTEKIDEFIDVFEGVRFKWRHTPATEDQTQLLNRRLSYDSSYSSNRSGLWCFELSFHKKHKEKVLNSYLPHILNSSKKLMIENRIVKLHTVSGMYSGDSRNSWRSVNLNHPATFEKLAMDDTQKKMILEDLEKFVERKEFYQRVGKAWKRGYLLYGPPGTGKSSLIAAMANYLKFDIYDLELTDLRRNSDLRKLLVATANRSILVVEDIDCSVNFQSSKRVLPKSVLLPKKGDEQIVSEQKPPQNTDPQLLTLSGMLNFMDGLWSSCGDERIIIFTTNNKDQLDPALLRPGRMDVHVHMSYCTPCGFRILANNYLKVHEHPAFEEIEQLMETTMVTPAEVAEKLMTSDDPDVSLGALVEFLHGKQLANQVVIL